jgi:hypothetical protein
VAVSRPGAGTPAWAAPLSLRTALIPLLVALACGCGERGASDEDAARAAADLGWVWRRDQGPHRDAWSDAELCREIARYDPRVRDAVPLKQLRYQYDCMERLGWARKDAPGS